MPFFETAAINGKDVSIPFRKIAEMVNKNLGTSSLAAMPTSLSGASGAMTLSQADDALRLEQAQQKKKMGCKC